MSHLKSSIRNFLSALLIFASLGSAAQNAAKFTVSGYITDARTGETLIGANVIDKSKPSTGTAANLYGFYSITLPAGDYVLIASNIGFDSKEFWIHLFDDQSLNITLSPKAVLQNAVVIEGERTDKNVESVEMGMHELEIEEIKKLPALMGEVDLMKTIQLLPGVSTGGEGNTGLYVRGGGPDQNLILLDEAVVYNTGHLLGFFSIFNSDAIKNITLYKGGMPAQYGGRVSSVLDVAMNDGNNKYYQVDGGIGIISSRLTIQGPIIKNQSSFIVSARRTYADIFIDPFIKDTPLEGTSYYFYDLNAKANYKFNDKNRLYLSAYFGRDVFDYTQQDAGFTIKIPWGNATTTLRWNHLFNNKLFMNVSAIYNDYNFAFQSDFDVFRFKLYSGVKDRNAKIDFDYFPVASHQIKFGANYTYHKFIPYSADGQIGDVSLATDSLNAKFAHEAAVYVQDEFDLSKKIKINIGLRGSYFAEVGPYNQILYSPFEVPFDTVQFAANEIIADYWGIDPRLNFRFGINKLSSVKGGITFSNQYIHLVTNSSSTLPTDLWVPSSPLIKPQRGLQIAAGYFRNFHQDDYETSVEVYYKKLWNQIEYGESSSIELSVDIENEFVFGEGEAYGVELFLNKKRGKLTGWIGYTFSYTNRVFPEINNGNPFPAKYDRRHDLEIIASYQLNERWNFAATFVYSTGQAITVPIGRYFIEGNLVNEYGDRNGFRMVPYHRMDIAAVYSFKIKKKFESTMDFSIYNLYSRLNPYFIYYDIDGDVADGNLTVSAKQVSIFPITPSITWNFKFYSNEKTVK